MMKNSKESLKFTTIIWAAGLVAITLKHWRTLFEKSAIYYDFGNVLNRTILCGYITFTGSRHCVAVTVEQSVEEDKRQSIWKLTWIVAHPNEAGFSPRLFLAPDKLKRLASEPPKPSCRHAFLTQTRAVPFDASSWRICSCGVPPHLLPLYMPL